MKLLPHAGFCVEIHIFFLCPREDEADVGASCCLAGGKLKLWPFEYCPQSGLLHWSEAVWGEKS